MEILPPPMTSGRTGAVPATWVLGYGTRASLGVGDAPTEALHS